MLRSVPNILTLSRIIAIPIYVGAFFLDQPLGSWIAFWVFTIAGVTDYLDGYLARSLGVVSRFGQFLDPIADKLMVAAAVLMLTAEGWVAGVHVIAVLIILCREILVSGLREFLASVQVSVPVTKLAKFKTAFQMIALGALSGGPALGSIGLPAQLVGLICLWIAGVLTLYTGYDYMRSGMLHMKDEPH